MRCRWFIVALLLLACGAWAADLRNAIVKVFTVHNSPDYLNPWAMRGSYNSSGSGCVIARRRILTNAHVVRDQTFVQVRRFGDARRYVAQVEAVAHDADLALLTVEDESFFEGIEPLPFGELPRPQQEVLVYGFPLGGDTLSITKGVVSRIEHQSYSHSSCHLLAVQIDAALNPGNSGGPAIVDDAIVGVAMMGIPQADNIGYIVPVPIIEHFLKDLEDGRRDGIPSLGLVLQPTQNDGLRRRYRLPPNGLGMLVIGLADGSPAAGKVQIGDVLLSIDGVPVAEDGTVEFRPRERTHLSYLIQRHQVGESVQLELLRDGQTLSIEVPLTRPLQADWLIPMEQYDRVPTYYIYGGIVFCPLTVNLLQSWGPNWYEKAPRELVARLSYNVRTPERSEVVVALRVLAARVNEGYHDMFAWTVDKVNGQPIRNLADLIRIVESSREEPFVEFQHEWGRRIILDRRMAEETAEEILRTYRIPSDRSPDLRKAKAN